MRQRALTGAAYVALGALIALGPQFVFAICDQTEHGVTTCFWTARAELGVGGAAAALGLLVILLGRTPGVCAGLSAAFAVNGVLALLLPDVLIGVCEHPHMACRLATLPALNLIGALAALLGAANAARLLKKSGKGGKTDGDRA
ncbi:MAG: DUF4418 family protein [Oscillospiraceae bacterium]|jgi:hypothetical protein|nr:DUF4418 family protein [Oscillospiraceae bacterium]